ncbi:unnamed protein product [Sphagnum jensenii]
MMKIAATPEHQKSMSKLAFSRDGVEFGTNEGNVGDEMERLANMEHGKDCDCAECKKKWKEKEEMDADDGVGEVKEASLEDNAELLLELSGELEDAGHERLAAATIALADVMIKEAKAKKKPMESKKKPAQNQSHLHQQLADEFEASVRDALGESEPSQLDEAMQSLAQAADAFEAGGMKEESEAITEFMELVASEMGAEDDLEDEDDRKTEDLARRVFERYNRPIGGRGELAEGEHGFHRCPECGYDHDYEFMKAYNAHHPEIMDTDDMTADNEDDLEMGENYEPFYNTVENF